MIEINQTERAIVECVRERTRVELAKRQAAHREERRCLQRIRCASSLTGVPAATCKVVVGRAAHIRVLTTKT